MSLSNKKQIFLNGIWLSVGEFLSRVIKFIVIIYVAKLLGVTDWGIFSYALGIGTILMTFSDLGINNYITRELSRNTENRDDYHVIINNSIFIKTFLLTVSTVLIIFLGPVISSLTGADNLFFIISLILLFDAARELALSVGRAFNRMYLDAAIRIVANCILIIGIIPPLKYDLDTIKLSYIYLAGSALSCLLIIFFLRKNFQLDRSKLKLKKVFEIAKVTAPLALVGLLSGVMANTDIYMLGIWHTAKEIGEYSAAQRLYQFILVIPTILTAASFAVVSKLANTDLEKLKETLTSLVRAVLLITIPMAAGVLIVGNNLIEILFGSEFAGAGTVFTIFMFMSLASFPAFMFANAAFALNKQNIMLRSSLVAATLNIVINFLLIPQFGAKGAAVSTLISLVISSVVLFYPLKKYYHKALLVDIKEFLFATFIMFIVALTSNHLGVNVLLTIFLSIICYLGLVYRLRPEYIKFFLSYFKKAGEVEIMESIMTQDVKNRY